MALLVSVQRGVISLVAMIIIADHRMVESCAARLRRHETSSKSEIVLMSAGRDWEALAAGLTAPRSAMMRQDAAPCRIADRPTSVSPPSALSENDRIADLTVRRTRARDNLLT